MDSEDKKEQSGLYFYKIGSRVLQLHKRTYQTVYNCRESTRSVFYRGQCEDSTPSSHKNKLNSLKKPSKERINSWKHPKQQRPKHTYPVVKQMLKQSDENQNSDSDAEGPSTPPNNQYTKLIFTSWRLRGEYQTDIHLLFVNSYYFI